MTEKNWYLKDCQLFQHLSLPEMQWLESRSRVRHFERLIPVYLPADASNGVLVLASGRVKLYSVTPDGKQTILAFIEPGEVFGELSLVEDGNGEREEHAMTTERSTIVLVPAADMKRIVEQNPKLALGVTRLIGIRRRRIERRLKNLLFHSNRDRLTHLLLELAEDYGTVADNQVDLSIRLSHQDLASIIGSTRETVTLILGQMQDEGLVQVGRRRISLCDVSRWGESLRVATHPVRRNTPVIKLPGTGPLGPAAT